jgi:hypothetical protein
MLKAIQVKGKRQKQAVVIRVSRAERRAEVVRMN